MACLDDGALRLAPDGDRFAGLRGAPDDPWWRPSTRLIFSSQGGLRPGPLPTCVLMNATRREDRAIAFGDASVIRQLLNICVLSPPSLCHD